MQLDGQEATVVEHAAVAEPARTVLGPVAAYDTLVAYGIPMARQLVAAGEDEVERAAARLGSPVALKAIVPGLVHRSDVGGVRVGLGSPREARAEAARMSERFDGVESFIVQEVVPAGHELIVGMRRDPVFGPFVLVGTGGTWVELLRDTVLRPAPVSAQTAGEMLGELRTASAFDGYRGEEALDRTAVAGIISAVSRLAVDRPDVVELDLNPVLVGPASATVVDSHIVTVDGPSPPSPVATRDAPELDPLLRPRSIVVVGASTDATKQGGRLLNYLQRHGYQGRILVVNPRTDTVQGVPSYRSVADLPEVPDLACIVVPSSRTVEVAQQCADLGVRAAVVYTSGFAEAGTHGQLLEAELTAIAERTGMRISGPNTAGVVSAHHALCAAIGMAFEIDEMPLGNIAFLTQSGALGSSLLSRTWADGIGFSTWVCCGNECDLTLSDYLRYLVNDPVNRVVSIFMEGIRDSGGFIEACRQARENQVPVLVYKTGASERGREAVASHTAALAGDDAVYDAIFSAHGVVRVHDLQGLIDASVALAWQPLPRGNRVAVVSASGGACSVIADGCMRAGLELPHFSSDVVAKLQRIVPPFGVADNPVDVTMEVTTRPSMIADAVEVVLAEADVDAVLVMLTTNAGRPAVELAQSVSGVASTSDKPILVIRVGAEFLSPESVQHYRANRIPVYPMPERAINALSIMTQIGRQRELATER